MKIKSLVKNIVLSFLFISLFVGFIGGFIYVQYLPAEYWPAKFASMILAISIWLGIMITHD